MKVSVSDERIYQTLFGGYFIRNTWLALVERSVYVIASTAVFYKRRFEQNIDYIRVLTDRFAILKNV